MEAVRTPDEIRDVNTRYHDVAASSYDSKWGIDFGEVGQAQVLGKLRKLVGAELDRGYEPLAGDRRRHRLLQPQPAQGRAWSGRPPAPTSRRAWSRALGANAAAARARRQRSASRRRVAARSPTAASTWCSATPCCTTSPTSPGRSPSSIACSRPGGRIVFAGEPSRFGDRLAAVPKRSAHAARAVVARALSARPAPAPGPAGLRRSSTTTSSSGSSTSTPSPQGTSSRLRRAGRLRPRSRSAARSSWPTGSAGSTGRSRRRPPPRTCRCSGVRTPSAAICCSSGSTSACSSRCSRRRSSTTCC